MDPVVQSARGCSHRHWISHRRTLRLHEMPQRFLPLPWPYTLCRHPDARCESRIRAIKPPVCAPAPSTRAQDWGVPRTLPATARYLVSTDNCDTPQQKSEHSTPIKNVPVRRQNAHLCRPSACRSRRYWRTPHYWSDMAETLEADSNQLFDVLAEWEAALAHVSVDLCAPEAARDEVCLPDPEP